MSIFHPHKNGQGRLSSFDAQLSKGKLKAAGFCTEDKDTGKLIVKDYEAYVNGDNIILTHIKPIEDRLENVGSYITFKLKNDVNSTDEKSRETVLKKGSVGKVVNVFYDHGRKTCYFAIQFEKIIDFIYPDDIDWTYPT